MLEHYLAETAENTDMVIFDRYFTFSLPGVYHTHLQLNLRETVELTSLYERWDHNTLSATCQPLLASAQGPLAPSFLGEHLPGMSGVREPKATLPMSLFPILHARRSRYTLPLIIPN